MAKLPMDPKLDAFEKAAKAWGEKKATAATSNEARNEATRLMHHAALTWADADASRDGKMVMAHVRKHDPVSVSDETAAKESAQWNAEIGAVRKVGLERVLELWPAAKKATDTEKAVAMLSIGDFRAVCVRLKNETAASNLEPAELIKTTRKASREKKKADTEEAFVKEAEKRGLGLKIDANKASVDTLVDAIRSAAVGLLRHDAAVATVILTQLTKIAVEETPAPQPQPANDAEKKEAA